MKADRLVEPSRHSVCGVVTTKVRTGDHPGQETMGWAPVAISQHTPEGFSRVTGREGEMVSSPFKRPPVERLRLFRQRLNCL